jgi:alkylation response protein AidB-like acyl-CoA dehydrogenase
MPDRNFYLDNPDLKFVMEKMVDWPTIFGVCEDFEGEDAMFENAEEAKEANLDMLATPIGELAGERIADRADLIDQTGCTLDTETDQVILPEGQALNMKELSEADLMGATLLRKYGGLEFTKTFYTAAIEIISRADASLMNLFGLQGIAETLQQFASEEICEHYLPRMATGELTGAMVLTEADAGSDLAAVRTKADLQANQDPTTGEWKIKGTKRFITNGCGDVHVVLARTGDPAKFKGSRGLSMLVTDRSCGKIHVRRIEHKLGINGSPTCELYYDDAPAQLVGKEGYGLVRYTAWLMAAARIGVSAQALGICEAALREGQNYATEREQFNKPIKDFPLVASMLADMKMYTEAVRAFLYDTTQVVDMAEGLEKKGEPKESKRWTKIGEAMTPMIKYYSTEWANRISYMAIQIHGGNGFMLEYPSQRLYRDARITNIYEGTSQIQIVWAAPRIIKGVMESMFEKLSSPAVAPELAGYAEKLNDAKAKMDEAVVFIKSKGGTEYRDLVAKELTDICIDTYIGWLFLRQAEKSDEKKIMLRRYMTDVMPMVKLNYDRIVSDRPLDIDKV